LVSLRPIAIGKKPAGEIVSLGLMLLVHNTVQTRINPYTSAILPLSQIPNPF
jgi:hypothetical protein